MDYEVIIIILTRVREEHDHTGAVIEGLGRTGRLVTSAALILFLFFASLASAPDTEAQVLATGLGILLDATAVRALLLPALVSLLSGGNWWSQRPWPVRSGCRRAAPRPALDCAGRSAAGGT